MSKSYFSIFVMVVLVITVLFVFSEPQGNSGKTASEDLNVGQLQSENERLKTELLEQEALMAAADLVDTKEIVSAIKTVETFLETSSIEEAKPYFSKSVTFEEDTEGEENLITFPSKQLYEFVSEPDLELMDFQINIEGVVLHYHEILPEEITYLWDIHLKIEEEGWKINLIEINFSDPILTQP
ncbi:MULTISPECIES: hypothetical protein [Bacillaceae]|uniref:DUF4829 domain-containing protein n=1 Tax=Evansella alkalicola TaxID=745819 RepID=A0ABS6K0A7_9BACI|nr:MULTISPECIES: hypothetical protein [Bacillaceae]MBU9724268.1 hypothetical protein [Bacillus alkalicola]